VHLRGMFKWSDALQGCEMWIYLAGGSIAHCLWMGWYVEYILAVSIVD